MRGREENLTLTQDHVAGSSLRHEKRVCHPCDGCFFFGGKQEYVKSCNYYLITGNRRPCDAGEGCTVRKDGKRRKVNKTTGFLEDNSINCK